MTKTKIITIVNKKNNAGKSTCAAHLSLEAVKAGLKTLIIDLDPQNTLENWWSKCDADNPVMTDIDSNKIDKIKDKVNKSGFDICIIDTPSDTSAYTTNGIRLADLVFIPTKPTPSDLATVGKTIAMINKEKKPYVFCITQLIPKGMKIKETMGILSAFGEVSPFYLPYRLSYKKAMESGSSASNSDNEAKAELKEVWFWLYKKLFNNQDKALQDKNQKEKILL